MHLISFTDMPKVLRKRIQVSILTFKFLRFQAQKTAMLSARSKSGSEGSLNYTKRGLRFRCGFIKKR